MHVLGIRYDKIFSDIWITFDAYIITYQNYQNNGISDLNLRYGVQIRQGGGLSHILTSPG